ncbi:MAG: hypothetical protein R3E12_02090 [Candidatus Eisenbacteria bacterium]
MRIREGHVPERSSALLDQHLDTLMSRSQIGKRRNEDAIAAYFRGAS